MNTHIVAGKYALLKKIASGGMAEVFLAKQLGLDGFEKLVVLKRILPHLADNKEFVRMFLDEARTAADLRHAHLVHTFEIGEDAGIYFMVMEFLHGQDIRTIFKSVHQKREAIPLGHAVGIIMDAASGIHYAHTKADLSGKKLSIIHRDISPQNIIVTYEGETKIVDFGIAKAAHQTRETISGVLKGKYGYMSPEQALGQPLDARTDLFALGIILYELTTMRRLFKFENEMATLRAIANCDIAPPTSVSASYPQPLSTIVMKALSKDREHRFENCEQLRAALENYLENDHLTHSASRLNHYMRDLFRDRLRQEEEALAQGRLDSESAMTLLWSSSRAGTSSHATHSTSHRLLSHGDGREETITNSKNRAGFWRRAQLGLVALLGGVLGLLMVAFVLSVLPEQEQQIQKLPEDDDVIFQPSVVVHEIVKDNPVESPSPAKIRKSQSPGRLKVVVEPWAEVYLNDVHIGSTPLAAKELGPGTYRLRLSNSELQKNISQDIVIASGKDTMVRHKW